MMLDKHTFYMKIVVLNGIYKFINSKIVIWDC